MLNEPVTPVSDGPIHEAEDRRLIAESDVEFRRERVVELRAMRMTLSQIARALGVSTATVHRDLAVIREDSEDLYARAGLNAAEVLGEAIARYRLYESDAYRLSRSPTAKPVERLLALREARANREAQMTLLQDLGLLNRVLGSITVGLPTAAQIRTALDQSGLDLTKVKFDDTALLG
jgi:AcrR family transcriptional regulator